MMKPAFINNLVARGLAESSSYNPAMVTALIVLLALVIVALVSVMVFCLVRYRRRSQEAKGLPMYEEKHTSTRSNHRRIIVRPTESLHVYQEKQFLIRNSTPPPSSPIPEIRITFPEEFDEAGKQQSGRVVVVRVGETSVGMEPFSEKLPAYQQSEADRFQSLDLDRIGGLQEKEIEARWR